MIKPRNNFCLLKRFESPTQTPAGLHLPPSARERPQLATVIAIGPKVQSIRLNQTVLFSNFSTLHEVIVDDNPYVLLKESDCFLVLEDVIDD